MVGMCEPYKKISCGGCPESFVLKPNRVPTVYLESRGIYDCFETGTNTYFGMEAVPACARAKGSKLFKTVLIYYDKFWQSFVLITFKPRKAYPPHHFPPDTSSPRVIFAKIPVSTRGIAYYRLTPIASNPF